jgi:hypothetical protein
MMESGTDHVTADQMPGTDERPGWAVRGEPVVVAILFVAALGVVLLFTGAPAAGIVLSAVALLPAAGLIAVQPNESQVLIVFGRYTGTIRRPGLSFVNPLSVFWRKTVSLRVRNFQTERSKVNDAGGSPIIIAAVVVWKVVETARALFDVERFEDFVVVQSETAVRHLASQYPYDTFDDDGALSLRGNAADVNRTLHNELQARLAGAGIEVLETRLTHLAKGIVELDEERKASMVSNLMVVLTGDRSPTPVINTGTLYGS